MTTCGGTAARYFLSFAMIRNVSVAVPQASPDDVLTVRAAS
jgi:hypothetical protein